MLLLLLSFVLLLLAFRRVVSRRPAAVNKSSTEAAKPSAYVKLLTEAFQYADPPSDESSAERILILYATEYGFAATVANTIAENYAAANQAGSGGGDSDQKKPPLLPRVLNVLHYNLIDFSRERFVAFICSTTGDGVPPNDAAAFRDALTKRDLVIPQSTSLAVLALGDKAYPHFCRAGATLDALLPQTERLLPRVDVDQEDWPVINAWADDLRTAIQAAIAASPSPSPAIVTEPSDAEVGGPQSDYLRAAIEKHADSLSSSNDGQYSRTNPFHSPLLATRVLTAPRKSRLEKEVVRVEFDTRDAPGLTYDVGDALAVVPRNNPDHVNRLLLQLALNGHELVRVATAQNSKTTETMRIDVALTELLDLRVVRAPLVATLARRSASGADIALAQKILGYDPRDPAHRPRNATATDFGKEYLAEREVYDVLNDFSSATIDAQSLVDGLRPLHARYYSISSSPLAHDGRIAITVDVLRFESLGINREGVCSTFLRERCSIGNGIKSSSTTQVPIYVMRNPNFRLPADDTKAIVMIGPGTGVAPFIAFLQEREGRAASGRNWLFFGCRHEERDFLYKQELLQMSERRFVELRTAFSRDGPSKVYVQDRMREEADTLWQLIEEEGAHLYVCGDGARMAGDVERALVEIVAEHGAMDEEAATDYVNDLTTAGRFQKDVWVP